ncbi:hypothetical protein EV421DRAFT_404491 [Armillaria borealis]|uniref:Uncharacterized protein n=1 Tax=Armillaria borealis TaxID=47425 RepID=A0AA39IU26_9AGAR|nr:hypothetical protein EV421DRAFT_404491 [Armillaria borealis]
MLLSLRRPQCDTNFILSLNPPNLHRLSMKVSTHGPRAILLFSSALARIIVIFDYVLAIHDSNISTFLVLSATLTTSAVSRQLHQRLDLLHLHFSAKHHRLRSRHWLLHLPASIAAGKNNKKYIPLPPRDLVTSAFPQHTSDIDLRVPVHDNQHVLSTFALDRAQHPEVEHEIVFDFVQGVYAGQGAETIISVWDELEVMELIHRVRLP